MTPPLDADLAGGCGREFRAIGNALQDGRYVVAELTDGGVELRITELERWQALAIVAVLHPPFQE